MLFTLSIFSIFSFSLRSDKKIISVHNEIIASNLVTCLLQSGEIFKELQFWAAKIMFEKRWDCT
jgi:hypothetical protein